MPKMTNSNNGRASANSTKPWPRMKFERVMDCVFANGFTFPYCQGSKPLNTIRLMALNVACAMMGVTSVVWR